MLGGVRLEGVHLTLRSKTDKLVLADASLTLLPGQAIIITGA
jgi:ABC-type multidrug transport system fused ATPase/permease subunit